MAGERQGPAAPAGSLKSRIQRGRNGVLNQYRRLLQTWQGLSKTQRYIVGAVVLLLAWNLVLQVQLLTLSKTVALQQVRISQLEKQAQRQNNLLYSASVTLNDIEKKWHSLNFRVLENTWRIEEPKKKTQTPCDESGFPFY